MSNTDNSCGKLSQGTYKKTCTQRRGGICAVYATNLRNIDEITVDVDFKVDTITMKPDVTGTLPWFELAIQKNTASVANDANVDGNKRTDQTITFTLDGNSTDTRQRFDELVISEIVFIAKNYMGETFMIGRKAGSEMTSGTNTSGAAASDLAGGEVIFFADGELESYRTVVTGITIDVLDEDGLTKTPVTL